MGIGHLTLATLAQAPAVAGATGAIRLTAGDRPEHAGRGGADVHV